MARKKRTCKCCGYTWIPIDKRRPKKCPKCKTHYWNTSWLDQMLLRNKKKELKYMKDDHAIVIPGRTLLVLLIVVCIFFLVYVWINTQNVECGPEDKVELKGLLRGFERNGSYWNVKLGNESYLFDVFDESYMKNFIGFDITINACFRHDTSFQVGHYDLVNCFIGGVNC